MRRSGHPSRPRAMTCCFFASLKTLLISTKATCLTPKSTSRASFSLAGFQVTLIGRFWVTPEGIKWANKLQGFDTWTVACLTSSGPNPNCPVPNSPDFDLGGSGPNLVGNIVGFGQKSGIFWALNPDNGNIVWSTPVGPGASLGGIEWGTATDGKRIYVAIANSDLLPYTLVPSGQQITWGAWSALDVATGKILWQTADPTPGSIDRGSVSVANGVMYVGSNSGQMYALNTATGNILWSFASGGSVIDGPSIVDGALYWGSGYREIAGTGNNKVYAFTLAGSDHGGGHSNNQGQK